MGSFDDLVNSIIGGLQSFGSALLESISSSFSYITYQVRNAIENLLNFKLDGLWGAIKGGFDYVSSLFINGVTSIGNTLHSSFEALFQSLNHAFQKVSDAFNWVRSELSNFATQVSSTFSSFSSVVSNAFSRLWVNIEENFKTIKSAFESSIANLINYLESVGRMVWESIISLRASFEVFTSKLFEAFEKLLTLLTTLTTFDVSEAVNVALEFQKALLGLKASI